MTRLIRQDKTRQVPQVAHDQAVARQKQKLVADFGVTMHLAWARHMLDNREFVVGGGPQPNTEPGRGGGLDGTAEAEERDNHQRPGSAPAVQLVVGWLPNWP